MTTTTDARPLSPAELAEYLGVPVATVYQWNSQGTGPRYVKVGRHVRYRRDDIAAWLEWSLALPVTAADSPRPTRNHPRRRAAYPAEPPPPPVERTTRRSMSSSDSAAGQGSTTLAGDTSHPDSHHAARSSIPQGGMSRRSNVVPIRPGYAAVAQAYLSAGLGSPLPLPRGSKKPPPPGWTGAAAPYASAADVAEWSATHPDGNVGLRLAAGIVGLDVDAPICSARPRESWTCVPAPWVRTIRDY